MKVISIACVLLVYLHLCVSAQIKSYSLKVDESDLDRSLTQPIQSYSSILKPATPAVVAVTTKQIVRRLYPTSNNPVENLYLSIS